MMLLRVLALVAIAASSTTAFAQDAGPALDPGLMVGLAPNAAVTYDDARKSGGADTAPIALGDLGKQLSGGLMRTPPAMDAATLAKLNYKPSPDTRKADVAQFVERLKAVDPQGATQLAAAFSDHDLIDQASGWMTPNGLRATNLADAVALYWVGAWLATQGSDAAPSKASLQAVRNQVAAAAINTPAVTDATDAQRQQLAEAMIIQALIVSQYLGAVKAHPELLDKVKAAAAAGAQNTFGFDIRTLKLSDTGFSL
jgi:hypothetical protein